MSSIANDLLRALMSADRAESGKGRAKKPSHYPDIFANVKRLSAAQLDEKLTTDTTLKSQVNAKGGYKGTPLCMVASKPGAAAAAKARVLIKHGADPNIGDTCTRFRHNSPILPLFIAFRFRNLAVAAVLFEYGAKIDQECRVNIDDDRTETSINLLEYSVLSIASFCDPIVELSMILDAASILKHSFHLDRKLFPIGKTMLGYVVYNNRVASTHLLLKWGADVTIADNDGFTPLHSVAMHDNTAIAILLTQYGASDQVRTTTDDEWMPAQKANCATKMAMNLGRWYPLNAHFDCLAVLQINADIRAASAAACATSATSSAALTQPSTLDAPIDDDIYAQ